MTDHPKDATPQAAMKETAATIREQAVVDAKDVNETREQRIKREAAEEKTAAATADLSRIDECRTVLARAYDTYRHSTADALDRLQGFLGGSADSEVQKTAKAVADAYDFKLDASGLKQPKTGK